MPKSIHKAPKPTHQRGKIVKEKVRAGFEQKLRTLAHLTRTTDTLQARESTNRSVSTGPSTSERRY